MTFLLAGPTELGGRVHSGADRVRADIQERGPAGSIPSAVTVLNRVAPPMPAGLILEGYHGMDLPTEPLRELALFAGAGGGLLGSRLLGWRTVCAVEIDPYRQAVLLARQADGCLDPFPIWDDVRTFDGTAWRGKVDIVTAGFPCQPFSVAGKRRGADDSRNGWPDTIRIIREIRPRFAFLENVPGLITSGYFSTVLGDLAEAGLDAEWDVFSACETGGAHTRRRVFILAYPHGERLQGLYDARGEINLQPIKGTVRRSRIPTPRVCRRRNDVPDFVDRIAALGDAQVPPVVATAWRMILGR